ncbi:hypothetical protein [Bacillus cereus]|nr:hypothetical protein [Bacillus cereus]
MIIDKFILDFIKEFQRNNFWKEMPPAEKERLAEIVEFLGGLFNWGYKLH